MVHTVNDIMRDLGFQFVRVMPEHIHFGNGQQPRFLKFVDVVSNRVECSVNAIQRMVNAQFVKLSDSHCASFGGALVRGVSVLKPLARPAVTYTLRLENRSPVIGGETRIRTLP